MYDCKSLLVAALVLSASSAAFASPLFLYQAPTSEAASAVADGAANAGEQIQQAAGQVQEAVSGQQQLPQRIQGHFNQLYSHGSSAVKSLADSVQPDLKNIGQDITDVYSATRNKIGEKIEPLAHTVKPYIDHAQKVVAPYVDQAKQEVPKLINQAGPALSKVGEQVKKGVTGVWGRITGEGGSQASQIAGGNGVQAAGEKVQQAATNAIQQVDNALEQPVVSSPPQATS